MSKPVVVIKAGGRAAEDTDALASLALEMKSLLKDHDFIFVHGGGAAVSAIQKTYGIEPVFEEGIRITSEKEMDLVDMGLAGQMNKKLVRLFNSCGLISAGISGADGKLFTGESIGDKSCRTGKIKETDPGLVQWLLKGEYTPVISPVSSDSEGGALNINADEAALAIGRACKAEVVLFISDIPGILNEGQLESKLNESEISDLIDRKIINGGMIPKVLSSLEALRSGAGQVVIGDYKESLDLERLLTGEKGTKIWLK